MIDCDSFYDTDDDNVDAYDLYIVFAIASILENDYIDAVECIIINRL